MTRYINCTDESCPFFGTDHQHPIDDDPVDLSDEAQLAIPKPDAPSIKQTLDLVGIRNSVVQSLMNRIHADEDRLAGRAQFDRDHQKPGEGPSESAVAEYKAGLIEYSRVRSMTPLRDSQGRRLYHGNNGIVSPYVLYMWTREDSRLYISGAPRSTTREDDESVVLTITPTHMQPDYSKIFTKMQWFRRMTTIFNIALIEQ